MTAGLEVTLTLRQDTALGGRPKSASGAMLERHVSGAVLRGALAADWIARNGEPSRSALRKEFEALFEGGVTFGPLFVGAPPLPLSVQRHKRKPDWSRCTVNEVDRALDSTTVCPCGELVDYSRGELRDAPAVTRRTHVEVSPEGTAVAGRLFSREVVRAQGTSFRGQVSGDRELLERFREISRLRVGGRRSTHGAAFVAWAPLDGTMYGAIIPTDKQLVVRLASPGIFVDDFGRSRPVPSDAELSRALGVEARVLRAWYRWSSVGGWHAASGLPKAEERCVAAGSTYVVALGAQPAPDRMAELARSGLGLRCHEGFGALAGAPTIRRWPDDEEGWRAKRAVAFARAEMAIRRDLRPRIAQRLRELAALRERGGDVAGSVFEQMATANNADQVWFGKTVLALENPNELRFLANRLEEI